MLRKILLIFGLVIIGCAVVYAGETKSIKRTQPEQNVVQGEHGSKIMFDNQEYVLKVSTNKTAGGEYVNEYYKENESKNDWSEMITVTEFPEYEGSTMDYAEMILSVDHSPNNYDRPISCNSKTDKVTFVYLMRGKNDKAYYMDYNAMQVLPYKKNKGLKCIQYTKRYYYTTRDEFVKKFNEINNEKNKYFSLVKDLSMPDVIKKEVR